MTSTFSPTFRAVANSAFGLNLKVCDICCIVHVSELSTELSTGLKNYLISEEIPVVFRPIIKLPVKSMASMPVQSGILCSLAT